MSQEIFKKYKIKAKKSLGQNFLVNDEIVEEIAGTIEVLWENIIEVWPGYGALTEKLLAKKPKKLDLVELDLDMIEILNDRISQWDLDTQETDFEIHKIDILKYTAGSDPYSVIANIPYYITSPILRHFLYKQENKPKSMVILMQMDVGEKILWWRTGERSSVLSLMVEKKANPYHALFVGKENFVPAPRVESSVILFESHDLYGDIDDDRFLKVIKIGFAAARKKLVKNFINAGHDKETILELFEKIRIHPNARGEDLNIKKWCEIAKSITLITQEK